MTQLNKIDENWDLFEYKTKIRTYLKKFDENWDQKDILTIYIYIYIYIYTHTHDSSLEGLNRT